MGSGEKLMRTRPLRTTVIGSYPFPGWLEFASQHLDQFGKDDVAEVIDDARASPSRRSGRMPGST